MTARGRRYRWWYLLLLLPVMIYVGGRWYVGYRIEAAIAQANQGDNTLTVADYTFGFFPLALTVSDLTFDQAGEQFEGRGTLANGAIRGISVWSLFGDGPVGIAAIELKDLEGQVTRLQQQTSGKPALALEVDEVVLDRISLLATDAPTGQVLTLHNFSLTLLPLHFPFAAPTIERLTVAGDTVRYQNRERAAEVLATTIGFRQEEAVTIAELQLKQGTDTDVRLRDIRLLGLNAEDLSGTLSIDTLSIGSVGGGARVQRNSEEAEELAKLEDKAREEPLAIRIGWLNLPRIDLNVSGSFGTVDYVGGAQSSELRYHDSLSVGRLSLTGDRVGFSGQDSLSVSVAGLTFEQRALALPLKTNPQGSSILGLDTLHVRKVATEVTAVKLAYRSETAELTGGPLRFVLEGATGEVSDIRLMGIERDAALATGVMDIPTVVISELRATVTKADGGSYRISLPQATLSSLTIDRNVRLARVQLDNGSVRQFTPGGKESLVANGIYVDQYRVATPLQAGTLGPLKLRVTRVELLSKTEPVDYKFNHIAYSSREGLLTMDSLQRRNRYSPDEMFRQKVGKSWLGFGMDGLRVVGIDHAALLRGKVIAVDSVSAQDFRIAVVEDISLDLPPKEKLMPIEALRRIGPRIQLRKATFLSTDISYGVVDTVLEAKTIHFREGTISINRLDTEISTTDSVYLSLRASFEGATPVEADFILARDSSGRNYAVAGRMGRYDLSGVNPLMEVAANAIVESGVIDEMTYRGRLQNELLTGDMRLEYHDLDLKVVGTGAFLKNLMSGLVMKKANVAGEDFRLGKMYHEHSSDKSFFNAYWKGLVSGMRSSALSDIVLQKELE